MQTTKRYSSPWRRLGLVLAVAMVAAATLFASGALPASAAGVGTYTFGASSYTVVQGGSVVVTVNRSAGGTLPSSVCWSIGGGTAPTTDYQESGGTLNFDSVNFPTSNSFTIHANPRVAGSSRTANITLSLPCGSDSGVINNPNPVVLTITDAAGPVVSSITPASANVTSTTPLTIVGTALTSPTLVTIGGHACAVGTSSATQITCTLTVSGATAGAADVVVTTGAGASTGGTGLFTFATGPTVTALSTSTGPSTGGTTVVITGTGFTGVSCPSGVTFGGAPAMSCSSSSSTSISAVSPAGTAGSTVDVVVTVSSTPSPITAADKFTYGGTATLSGITPPAGSTAGGNSVTLTGTNLTGASSVFFGSSAGSNIVVSNAGQTLTVTAPGGTGTVNVTVNTPQGNPVLTNAYTYTTGPVVTSISPTTCPTTGGQSVTINGFNLGTTLGATQVTVGGTPGIGTTATVTSVSFTGTTVTFLCPALAGNSYHVVVTVANVSSPQTNADLLTYASTGPAITSIFPTTGPTAGNTSVTITGVNLSSPTSVTFGGVAASFTPISATQITAVSPAHAGGASVEVQVTTSAGTTVLTPSVDTFIYADFGAPTITAITPATDANACGTVIPVTITGTNFTVNGSLMSLTFGGVAAQFSVPTTTLISAILPAHAAGAVNVVVTTNSGSLSFTATNAFTYTCSSAPTVSSVSPSSGAPGSTVTITGSGFTGVICPSGVTFGGVQATSCTVSGDTSITAVVPTNLPSGTTDVRVTNASGTSAINTATDSFTNTQSGATVSYTLYAGFTLIGWVGQDGISAQAALQGPNPPVGNPPTNNVSGVVTVIWRFDASSQTFKAFFPGQNVPGANDFTTLSKGTGYFIGTPPGTATTTWVVQAG